MKNSSLQVIPTLFLTGGQFCSDIFDDLQEDLKTRTSDDAFILKRKIESLGELENYLGEKLPDEMERTFGNFIGNPYKFNEHDAWPGEMGPRIVLMVTRRWMQTRMEKCETFAGEDNRSVLLVVVEDEDDLESDRFWELFFWVSELEFVENCWWVDSRGGGRKYFRDFRKEQVLSWLKSMTYGKSAGVLHSESVVRRSFSGGAPRTMGSFRIVELPLEKGALAKALCALYMDRYVEASSDLDFHGSTDEIERVMDRVDAIVPDGGKDNLEEIRAVAKDAMTAVFRLKGSDRRVACLERLSEAFGKRATCHESIQDLRYIEEEERHFLRTLKPFQPTRPAAQPPGPVAVPRQRSFGWVWVVFILALASAIFFLFGSTAYPSAGFKPPVPSPHARLVFLSAMFCGIWTAAAHRAGGGGGVLISGVFPWISLFLGAWVFLCFSLSPEPPLLGAWERVVAGAAMGACLGVNTGLAVFAERRGSSSTGMAKRSVADAFAGHPVTVGALAFAGFTALYLLPASAVESLLPGAGSAIPWWWRVLVLPGAALAAQIGLVVHRIETGRMERRQFEERSRNEIMDLETALSRMESQLEAERNAAEDRDVPRQNAVSKHEIEFDLLTRKIVLLRNAQDVMKGYMRYLGARGGFSSSTERPDQGPGTGNDKMFLLPGNLRHVRGFFDEIEPGVVEKWLARLARANMDDRLPDIADNIESCRSFVELYDRWLDSLVEHACGQGAVDETLTGEMSIEIVKKLVAGVESHLPELMLRIDRNYFSEHYIVEQGQDFTRLSHEAGNMVAVAGSDPDRIKIIRYGQYLGG